MKTHGEYNDTFRHWDRTEITQDEAWEHAKNAIDPDYIIDPYYRLWLNKGWILLKNGNIVYKHDFTYYHYTLPTITTCGTCNRITCNCP